MHAPVRLCLSRLIIAAVAFACAPSVPRAFAQDEPSSNRARVTEALAKADTSPQQAADLLLGADDKWSGAEIRKFDEELLFAGPDDFTHQLALWDVLTRWINGLADAHRPLPSGAIHTLIFQPRNLASSRMVGAGNLPSLYVLQPPKDLSKDLAAAAANRRATHEALCRALLRHPETAEAGFKPLAAFALAGAPPFDSLVPEAERILQEQSNPSLQERLKGLPDPSETTKVEPELELLPLSPVQYLLAIAARTHERERWAKQWLPMAQANLSAEEKAKLLADAELWFCDANDFDRAAQARLQAGLALGRSEPDVYSTTDITPLLEVLAPWELRQLDVPLNSFLVALAKSSNSRSMNTNNWLRYATLLSQAGKGDSLTELSRSIRPFWKPSAADRPRSLDDSGSRHGQQPWDAWVLGLGQRASQLDLALSLLAEDGTGPNSPTYATLMEWATRHSGAEAQALMALLNAQSWLKDAADFPLITAAQASDPQSLPGKLRDLSLPEKAEQRRALRTRLEQITPPTFGSKMMVALLADDPPAELSKFAKQSALQLSQLPPTRRLSLSRLWEPFALKLQGAAAADPELGRVLAPIMNREWLELEAQFVEHEAPRDAADPGGSVVRRDALRWLELTAEAAPERVPDVIAVCLDAVRNLKTPETRPTTNNNRFSSNAQETPVPVSSAGAWLCEAARLRHLLPAVWAAAQREKLDKDIAWQNHFISSLTSSDALFNAEYAARCLDNGYFLEEAPRFRSLSISPGKNLLATLTREMNQTMPGAARYLALDSLARHPHTFGAELVQALLDHDSPSALRDFIYRRSKDFAQLSPEAVAEVTQLLEPALRGVPANPHELSSTPALVKDFYTQEQKRIEANERLILDAGRVGDTNWQDTQLSANTRNIMTYWSEAQPARSKAVFLKALSLLEAKQEAEGVNIAATNGWTIRSQILSEWTQFNPSLATIALSCQLMNEDESGQLEHSGWSQLAGWGQALYSAWIDAGGDAAPEHGAELVLNDLRKRIEATPPAILALGFHDWVHRLHVADQKRVVTWAEAQPTQDGLARELAIAGRLFLIASTDRDLTGTLPGAVSPSPDQTPLWDHYRETVLNEHINPRVRLALAHHLCYRYPLVVDPAIIREGARLEAQELGARHVTHGYQLAPIVNAFCARLPRDSQWQETANRLWRAWDERNAHNNENWNMGRAYSPTDVPLLTMLKLAAIAGDEDRVSAMLQDFGSIFNAHLDTVPVLIQYGMFKQAEAFIKAHASDILLPNKVDAGDLPFSPALDTAVQNWAKSCTDPALEAAGEALCLMVDDPPAAVRDLLTYTLPKKDPRLNAFAKKLIALPDDSAHLRNLAARWLLTEHPGALQPLRAALEEDVKTILPKIGTRERVRNEYWRPQLVGQVAALHGMEGDYSLLTQTYETLNHMVGDNYDKQRRIATLLTSWDTTLLHAWDNTSAAHAQDSQPVLRQILSEFPYRSLDEASDACAARLLALHVVSRDTDGLRQWRASLSPLQEASLRGHLRKFDPISAIKVLVRRGSPISAEAQRALVTRLLADPWLQESRRPLDGWLPELILKQKLAPADELLAHKDSVAAAWTQNGEAAQSLGELAERLERWSDAAQCYQLAAQSCAVGSIPQAQWMLKTLASYVRAGDTENAKQVRQAYLKLHEEVPGLQERSRALFGLIDHN